MAKTGSDDTQGGASISEDVRVYVQATLTEHLESHGTALKGEMQEQIGRVLAATSFQALMEHTVDQLAAIAAPLGNLAPKRNEPDEQQLARLKRIAMELERLPETKPYLNSGNSVPSENPGGRVGL